jgi:hypothetical protein
MRLVEALKALRKALAAGPEKLTDGIVRDPGPEHIDLAEVPRIVAAADAAVRAREASLNGEGGLNEAITPLDQMSEIHISVSEWDDAWHIQSLPARPATLRELDQLIEDLAGPQVAPADDAEDSISVPAETCLFRLSSAFYEVRYEGESGTIPANLAGARYVAELLQHPHTFRKATELRRSVESADSGRTDSDEYREALRKCHEELERTKADIEEASRGGNEAEKAELVRKQESINAEVRRLSGLGGKARHRNPDDSARVSVTKSINLIIQKCREEYNLPRFSRHLDDAIETGSKCAYRPSNPAPEWQF